MTEWPITPAPQCTGGPPENMTSLMNHDSTRIPGAATAERELNQSAASGVYVSIIIANYNARDLLADCLNSIYREETRYSFEVLVVDDHSNDDSFDMVKTQFPQVRAYRNEANLHYATSNNRMFDVAAGRYLFLLNNDAIVKTGSGRCPGRLHGGASGGRLRGQQAPERGRVGAGVGQDPAEYPICVLRCAVVRLPVVSEQHVFEARVAAPE